MLSDQTKFGEILKELRKEKKITQEQLAESIDKSSGAVGQYERGEIFPNYETLTRIIETLDVDANLFFSGKKATHTDISDWVLNLFFKMTDSERMTIGKFLTEFAHVMLRTPTNNGKLPKGNEGNEDSYL